MKTQQRDLEHQPREAVLGVIDNLNDVPSVLDHLVSAGIDATRCVTHTGPDKPHNHHPRRLHAPHWINDSALPDINRALGEGHTIVAIFDVAAEHAHEVKHKARGAGLANLHYFGKWSYS